VHTVTALVLFALAVPIGAEAGQEVLSLKWSELATCITGKNVRVVLTGGVHLEGRATSVGAESLTIEVNKSSDPDRFRNTASVGRPELARLEVRKSGWMWKVVAPILGCVGFGIGGTAIGKRIDPYGFIISDGAIKGGLVGGAAGIGTGLVVGWLADRHYVRIDIVQ
jgi:hypothetical protein